MNADPTQIHQILINLGTNAGRAMRDDGGVMEIRVGQTEVDDDLARRHVDLRPGHYVTLTVTDTGPGVPPEIAGRIFEPFFTSKGTGEGTGMGLAVVYGIVSGYGGAVLLHDAPVRGAQFEVFLPGAEGEAAVANPETSAIVRGEGRILLVDDEPDVLDTAAQMLRYFGYVVEAHTSGESALGAFVGAPGTFDAVMTDQSMPLMSGSTLARHVQASRPGTPVILCSGLGDRILPEEARALGVRAHLMKPLVMRELAKCVRSVLKPAGSSAAR